MKLKQLATFLAAASLLSAALTEAQRVQDFESINALYAKSYGPANWKIQALGVNIFTPGPWLQRIRAAKSDLQHVQTLIEYVATFEDTHTQLTMTSGFVANLGFRTDLYDGKVLIETIDRTLLPAAHFPFAIGDELVSVDGQASLDLGRELSRNMGWGNPRATLRWAIRNIGLRAQSVYPFAVDLPDESTVIIRRQSGALETYRLRWTKTGHPMRDLGSAPMPAMLSSGLSLESTPASEEDENPLKTERPALWKVYYEMRRAASSAERNGVSLIDEYGQRRNFEAVRGYGAVTPIWSLPDGFQVRLGRNPGDFFFTGTYTRDGLRIGYLRLRNFGFTSPASLNQLAAEIQFFNNNTDGLVVDVMRNTGGLTCSAANTISMLIPNRAEANTLSFRPRPDHIQAWDRMIAEATASRAPEHILDSMRFERGLLIGALEGGRGMTGGLSICGWSTEITGAPFAYSKPLITLIDDFSVSAGDLFPSMMQDNGRGKLVGTRTNGAGGSLIGTFPTPWSMSATNLTESMMLRNRARRMEGFPENNFIENVGVRPDIELDYMTTANLMENGRPFVDAFTNIIVNEIRSSRP